MSRGPLNLLLVGPLMFESPESLPSAPWDDASRPSEPELPPAEELLEVESEPVSRPLPRPGLGLAILIVLAIPLVHLMTTLIYVMAAVPELLSEAAVDSLVDRLPPGQLIRLLAFDQGMFVLLAFLAAWLVFRPRFGQVIPLNLPRLRHVALIFLLVLPLAVMDGFLAQQVINVGESVFGESPSQGELPELLNGVTKQASTGLLLLILAVLPALGEELVFRGVIGRGLIARKGLIFGILWTSVLFSVVHGNPVQAVGVFFVGVMCHVSYLATRSLLAPILLHFLNNTLPVMALKAIANQPENAPVAAADQVVSSLSPLIALAAMICVAVLGGLLWSSRVEYLDEEGAVLAEDVPTVELPAGAVYSRCRPVNPSWVAWASVAYLLFLASGSLAVPT